MERNSTSEVVRCSVEKESIPKKPVDLKILRSNFEVSSKDTRRSGPQSQTITFEDLTNHPDGRGGDFIDSRQPPMSEVLTKFRQLEKKGRPGKSGGVGGGQKRSSSADRVQGRRSSDDEGRPHLSFWDPDETDGASSPPSQTMTLIALFSQMEGKKKGAPRRGLGSVSRSFGTSQTVKGTSAKNPNGISDRHGAIGESSDDPVELPEEGLVQTLLIQWKAMEKPAMKKQKKIWTPPPPPPLLHPPVGSHLSENHRKSHLFVTGSSVPTQHPKSPSTGGSTKSSASGSASNPSQRATSAPTGHHGHQTKHSSSSNEVTMNGTASMSRPSSSDVTDHHHHHSRPVEKDEKMEESVPAEGTTKNMMEKFQLMEKSNISSSHSYDSLPRKRSFKWEVRETHVLGGRTHGHPNQLDPDFDLAKTHTPPSSPDPDHHESHHRPEQINRQPDLVEHSSHHHHHHQQPSSSSWKDELPHLPSQTKNLMEKYEALQNGK